MTPGRAVLTAVCSAAVLLVPACTGDDGGAASPPDTAPRARATDCPPDVIRAVVGRVECRVVDVPERPGRSSRTVGLHLTLMRPPGAQSAAGTPILVVGTNLAATPNYLGIAPLAQRTGRDVLVLDARGTGHSSPSLDCPEVHDVAAETLGVPSAAAAVAVGEAVEACADRLVASGVDLDAYGLDAMAADLEAVRLALGLRDLDVVAYGSTGAALVPFVARHGEHLRSVTLDSPLVPTSTPPLSYEQALSRVATALVAVCARSEACPTSPVATLDAARERVRREPITLRLPSGPGGLRDVLVDDERFLRILRQMTSDGGSSGTALTLGSVPRFVRDVARGDAAALERWLGPALAGQEPFCLGRSPSCLTPRHHLSVGSWLTVTCGDLGAAGAEPDLCASWPVDSSPAAATSVTPSWTVPTLVLVGRYTTYQSPAEVRSALSGVPGLTWLEDPAAGNAVMARSTCVLDFRDAWLPDPRPTPPPPCLEKLTIALH